MQYFIIGERELVMAFRFVGVHGAIAETREDVLDAFKKVTGIGGTLIEERPNILILTEAAAAMISEEEIEWQKSGRFPLIVEVPGLGGHLEGRKTLTQAISEAIGVKV